MIHCICIKFGTKYSDEYVNKLFGGIKRNTSKGFLFTCFSDRYNTQHNIVDDVDVQPLPLQRNDWFAKIGLYHKELYYENDQIFYFDLDTVIVGNLDEIFEYSGNFMILRDFYRRNGYGSGLMSWRPHAVDHMAKNYHGQKCAHGDQGWPEQQYPGADIWQEQYPEKVISYKVHVQRSRRPNPNWTNHPGSLETASIVCFHGRPMPHDVANLNWMKEHWK